MNNKLLVPLLLLVMLFIPFNVFAEECKQDSTKIESIELKEKSKNVEELSPAAIVKNKINLDVKMYDVGDYIEYKLKVYNGSNKNFYFDSSSLNISSDYSDYFLDYKDKSNKIEPGSKKTVYLVVKYKKKVE